MHETRERDRVLTAVLVIWATLVVLTIAFWTVVLYLAWHFVMSQ